MISVMISGTVSGTIRHAKLNLLFVLAMGAVSISTGCASEPAPPTKAAVAVNKDLGDNDSVDEESDADAEWASDDQSGCDSLDSTDSAALALSDSSSDATAACDTDTAGPSKVKTGVPAPTVVSAPSPLPPSSSAFPGSNPTGSLASSNPLGGAGGGLGSLLGGLGGAGGAAGGLGSLLGGLGGAGGGLGSLLGGAGGLGGLLGGLGGAPTGSP